MDHYAQLLAFVWVIECGNFSAAAREHERNPSTISKLISALEARLQVRLFVRGTQSLALTAEGVAYEPSARAVIEAMTQADSMADTLPTQVSGVLRIHTMQTFAKHQILRWLPEFLDAYPDLSIDLRVGAQYIDMFDQGIDVAIHTGALPDSSRVALPIGLSEWIVCAAPAYLQAHGTPAVPADLLQHRCFNFSFISPWNSWTFCINQEPVTIPVVCRTSCSQGDLLRDMALAGAGIVRLADFHIGADLRAGRLVPLLQEFRTDTKETLYLIYPHRKYVSPKVRALHTFLENKIALHGWGQE
jgi:DNA-binding transcriptional LysR family regulator